MKKELTKQEILLKDYQSCIDSYESTSNIPMVGIINPENDAIYYIKSSKNPEIRNKIILAVMDVLIEELGLTNKVKRQ